MNNEITRERLEQVVKEAAEQISSELLLDDGSLIDPCYLDLCCTGSIVDALIMNRFRTGRTKGKISLQRMQDMLRDRRILLYVKCDDKTTSEIIPQNAIPNLAKIASEMAAFLSDIKG